MSDSETDSGDTSHVSESSSEKIELEVEDSRSCIFCRDGWSLNTNNNSLELPDKEISAALSAFLECPACNEVLLSPIFQCENGHLMCETCIDKQGKCYTCDARLGPSVRKIRNTALENVFGRGDIRIQCPHKMNGCEVITTVDSLKAHLLESCEYRPIYFCQKFLDWKKCKVPVTDSGDSSILSHLETCHAVHSTLVPVFRLCFDVGELKPPEEAHYFPISLLDKTVLLKTSVSKAGHLEISSILLKNLSEAERKNFKIKIRMESTLDKDVILEWTGFMQYFRKFKSLDHTTRFRMLLEDVKEFVGDRSPPHPRKVNKCISLKVAVWRGNDSPVPSLEGDIETKLKLQLW